MFRRPSIRYGSTPQPETPYQRAGQVWDDRIGSARVQARNWRYGFFGVLGLSLTLSGGIVVLATRGSVTPWVVQVDRLGQADAVAPAVAVYHPTDPQIAWHLARFVEDVRSVPADPVVLRHNWLEAYQYVTDKGAVALSDYARNHDPFGQVGKAQVSVEIGSVVRASDDSFRVGWTERRYLDGTLQTTERWSAILTIRLQTPTDADRLKQNPLGVYIHALNWSKELG
jgi:type IV secretory pathway TrbF-like protein